MCQLLGMNCNTPTDICFSFTGFQARGGLTDHHRDGWGIAFYDGNGVRIFLDAQATIDSPIAALVRHYPIRSKNVIAHIRKATRGAIGLENTHPFQRELWGRYWIFAHNGHLRDFAPDFDGSFLPVGATDSERAFCYILQSLRMQFPQGEPDADSLYQALRALAGELGAYGEFNFLLADGLRLYAHCASRLAYIVRQAPFGVAHLKDQDLSVDFKEVTTPDDRVAVIATIPLTDDEPWQQIDRGTLLAFKDGQAVHYDDMKTGAGCEPGCSLEAVA
ncbi:class II glutamine amidotransferase [Niveibacterium sp. 24ML]|uniref:class II glutamine amidotransferase n=1 Tax=Niveibacterium sp. 24ML TaxID=2985512 RepID=UPI002270CBAB|nr:class II glutamine amidotransferase [Niveibacterium sp. 24ML]MCX9157375.1 class II glutamine amidotransferase [Niveibacterium sp. 24ML]